MRCRVDVESEYALFGVVFVEIIKRRRKRTPNALFGCCFGDCDDCPDVVCALFFCQNDVASSRIFTSAPSARPVEGKLSFVRAEKKDGVAVKILFKPLVTRWRRS